MPRSVFIPLVIIKHSLSRLFFCTRRRYLDNDPDKWESAASLQFSLTMKNCCLLTWKLSSVRFLRIVKWFSCGTFELSAISETAYEHRLGGKKLLRVGEWMELKEKLFVILSWNDFLSLISQIVNTEDDTKTARFEENFFICVMLETCINSNKRGWGNDVTLLLLDIITPYTPTHVQVCSEVSN